MGQLGHVLILLHHERTQVGLVSGTVQCPLENLQKCSRAAAREPSIVVLETGIH